MKANAFKNTVHTVTRRLGFDVVAYPPRDFDPATVATVNTVRPYTLTSAERIHALCEAVRYVVRCRVPGSIVECGVWRGGSMMAAVRTLSEVGDTSRDIWLYDTFAGMAEPGEHDRFISGQMGADVLAGEEKEGGSVPWCAAGLAEVQATLAPLGYPRERFHFVEGAVEETIPGTVPDRIALLRLDTDWYESTRHELIHLFPLLSVGAVLIVDDYGVWEGARRAVDEYLLANDLALLLCRIDTAGRIAVVLPRAERSVSEVTA